MNVSPVALLVQAVLAIGIPMVATWAATALTKAYSAVGRWPDWEKRLLVAVYAVCMTGVGHALGLKLPEAFGALSSADVQAILSAATAMLLHRLLNPPQPPVKI